jgi:6-pyruvoyltetrahydropterin/6-carboxytetrahydropterin synthase
MYEITVDRTFCAAHALMISGQREPLHGHNWHVTVTIAGEVLDDDGLLCDFHTVGRVLKDVCRPFRQPAQPGPFAPARR